MTASKTILVGAAFPPPGGGADGWQPKMVRADSYRDLQLLLQRDSNVSLLCTDVTLPDGDWCDVLRLAVSARMTGEIRVVGADGRTVLRLEMGPRLCSVQAFDPAMHQSLAYGAA